MVFDNGLDLKYKIDKEEYYIKYYYYTSEFITKSTLKKDIYKYTLDSEKCSKLQCVEIEKDIELINSLLDLILKEEV